MFPYKRREALTLTVMHQLVHAVIKATGIDPTTTQHPPAPGGYKGKVNPSLHCHVTINDDGAEVVAAALGWVFRQESVLVADLRDRVQGRIGYAIVDLGEGPLLADRAEAFFVHGASVATGLDSGFSAFDGDMLYLNLRDVTGRPYSGLEDGPFLTSLQRSASSFGTFARLSDTGIADARLVENDWDQAPDGEQYAAKLRNVDMAQLVELRARHSELVRAALTSSGGA